MRVCSTSPLSLTTWCRRQISISFRWHENQSFCSGNSVCRKVATPVPLAEIPEISNRHAGPAERRANDGRGCLEGGKLAGPQCDFEPENMEIAHLLVRSGCVDQCAGIGRVYTNNAQAGMWISVLEGLEMRWMLAINRRRRQVPAVRRILKPARGPRSAALSRNKSGRAHLPFYDHKRRETAPRELRSRSRIGMRAPTFQTAPACDAYSGGLTSTTMARFTTLPSRVLMAAAYSAHPYQRSASSRESNSTT